jgi:hypothetical protein
MPSPISPFFDRELKAEMAGVSVSPISPFFGRELKTAIAEKKASKEREQRKPSGVPRAASGAINDAINRRTTMPRRGTFRQSPSSMGGTLPSLSRAEGGAPSGAKDARLNEILTASPKQLTEIYNRLPEEERPVHIIRGTDQSYFGTGTAQEYGTLRESLIGGQRSAEATAGSRLSLAKERYDKEQAAADFTVRAGGVLGKYITRGEEGDMLDPRFASAFKRAKAMSLDDPKGALGYLTNAVKLLEGQGKDTAGIGGGDINEGIRESVGKQTQRLTAGDIDDQISTLSVEDIDSMESANFITSKKAQDLRKRKLFWQKWQRLAPKWQRLAPETPVQDNLYGSSSPHRLGEIRY